MNHIWSDNVQGVMTLYLSRKLRFDDMFFEQYQNTFDLDENADTKILEIGCGPGALAETLHRWYPKAQITAIDRDSRFISFAKENTQLDTEYIAGKNPQGVWHNDDKGYPESIRVRYPYT